MPARVDSQQVLSSVMSVVQRGSFTHLLHFYNRSLLHIQGQLFEMWIIHSNMPSPICDN